MIDNTALSVSIIGKLFKLNGKTLEKQYYLHLSDSVQWEQREHAQDWLLFEENIGESLSIDETSLSMGELYTILTNKKGKGRKGTLVAIIKGTDSKTVISILEKISKQKRNKVKEITLDMAGSMKQIASKCFKKATQVTDLFHVQQLAVEALQQIRVGFRWEAIEQENKEMELAKETGKKLIPDTLENGDTPRQLLVRSRYLLFKNPNKWTPKQRLRSEILFARYPDIEQAYKLTQELRGIYEDTKEKSVAMTKLARWYDKVEKAGFKSFNTISRTIQLNYATILNYFDNRSTNASAESFNAKIKAFRTQFRGVSNIPFFLYRLSKLYA